MVRQSNDLACTRRYACQLVYLNPCKSPITKKEMIELKNDDLYCQTLVDFLENASTEDFLRQHLCFSLWCQVLTYIRRCSYFWVRHRCHYLLKAARGRYRCRCCWRFCQQLLCSIGIKIRFECKRLRHRFATVRFFALHNRTDTRTLLRRAGADAFGTCLVDQSLSFCAGVLWVRFLRHASFLSMCAKGRDLDGLGFNFCF